MRRSRMSKLANCPLCQSDQVYTVSGVSYGVKCQSCWHVKVQCFDSKEEAVEAWNKLFKDLDE